MKGKNILLGITGGIAAYKIPNLASMLVKAGCNVDVIMTKNAENFITAHTFEALTSNRCITDTFDRNHPYNVKHVSLAGKADCLLIAPATANVIGKIANGIADDMLTTTVMACKCPVIIAPAMNVNMFENPIVQSNIEKLKAYGYAVVEPKVGYLACGTTGAGKMPEVTELYSYIERAVYSKKDLQGKAVLVTAGPTREAIDPVRFITNNSTGKMGYAIARAAMLRGADVTLIAGHTDLAEPPFVNTVKITSAEDMFNAVTAVSGSMDIIIKAAAVADYTPLEVSENKVKKSGGDMYIPLKRTKDILKYLGEHKKAGQYLCGFSMETENMLENSRRKLVSKNLDMIVANNLKVQGAGFGTDTNVITLITTDEERRLDIMSKLDCANAILDSIIDSLE